MKALPAGRQGLPFKGENAMDEDRIRQRAYEIWEREGRPEGRHEDHWHRAHRELTGEDADGSRHGAGDTGNLGRAAADMGRIEAAGNRIREEAIPHHAPGASEEAGGGA